MSKKTIKKQPVKANQTSQLTQNSRSAQPDKKTMILVIAASVIGIIMAVISWMILPDSVATQFQSMDTGAPDVPKFVAVALPLGITLFSAVQTFKYPDSIKICLVGYAANILFWLSNM